MLLLFLMFGVLLVIILSTLHSINTSIKKMNEDIVESIGRLESELTVNSFNSNEYDGKNNVVVNLNSKHMEEMMSQIISTQNSLETVLYQILYEIQTIKEPSEKSSITQTTKYRTSKEGIIEF